MHLEAGEEAEAVSVTEASFKDCAQFSQTCAGEVAPGVVQEIRLSGLAVNSSCRAAMGTAQKNGKTMDAAHQCEQDARVSVKLLGAVSSGNIDKAIEFAHYSLAKCMKLPEDCAFQFAPVMVNQVVTMAMMQQTGMMPVFVGLKSIPLSSPAAFPIILIAQHDRQLHQSGVQKGHVVSFLQRN